jgi:outer membrane immunogenic protein
MKKNITLGRGIPCARCRSVDSRGLAQPVYKAPPPLAPPVFGWSGWYVGLNAGGGWSDNGIGNSFTQGDCTFAPASCAAFASTFNSLFPQKFDTHPSGFIGGGQIGYSWQFVSAWVAGIEADFQGSDIRGTQSFANGPVPLFSPPSSDTVSLSGTGSQRIDWFGTLRGQVGWLAANTLLVYATGGLAYGHTQTVVSFSGNFQEAAGGIIGIFPATTALSQSRIKAGWAVGGGLEWMLAPQWSVKGEYLYYDLGHVTLDQTFDLQGTPPAHAAFNIHSDTHFRGSIARLGVNYHF